MSGQIVDSHKLKSMSPEEIQKATAEGRCDALLAGADTRRGGELTPRQWLTVVSNIDDDELHAASKAGLLDPFLRRPPAGLGRRGGALWRRVVAEVDAAGCDLDARELELLAQACRAASVLGQLEAVVARDGVMATGSKGQTVVHGAVAEARQQRLVILRLLAAIGLEERSSEAVSSSPASQRARRAADARWSHRDRVRALREAS
jgi:P27 family predicted phage terminase small subunit